MEKTEKLSILLTAPGISIDETIDVRDIDELREMKATVSRTFKKFIVRAEQKTQSTTEE